MLRRSAVCLGGGAGLLLATADPAAAHGLGSRTDLPLPLWMFTYGAAAALLISFAALAAFWRTARLEGGTIGRVVLTPGRLARGLAVVARVVGLASFVLVVAAAAFGDPGTVENIAPVFVYVVFWVGMTLISALVGDLWRMVSPFDTLAAVVARLTGTDRQLAPYRFGRWPAVAGLSGFVWLELVYSSTPSGPSPGPWPWPSASTPSPSWRRPYGGVGAGCARARPSPCFSTFWPTWHPSFGYRLPARQDSRSEPGGGRGPVPVGG